MRRNAATYLQVFEERRILPTAADVARKTSLDAAKVNHHILTQLYVLRWLARVLVGEIYVFVREILHNFNCHQIDSP